MGAGDGVAADTRELPVTAAAQAIVPPEAPYEKLPPGPGRGTSEVAAHQKARIHSAMIQTTAEQGYEAVKVRDVVRLAGVSTRAFYELFDGKEDCFLRTHELVVRRAAGGVIVSQAGERDWRNRIGLVFDALAHALEHEPGAVRLAVVNAYAAGPAALEQARRAQSTIEALVGETFARPPNGIAVPPLLVEGMVAAVGGVFRAQVLAGRERDFLGLIDNLKEWALCYADRSAATLAELDSRPVSLKPASEPSLITPGSVEDDRAIILAAAAKLAATGGYLDLTIPRIRAGAGLSRRRFNAHFKGVEDCFIAVLEQRGADVLEQVGRAQIVGRTWAGGLYRAMAVLCELVASDPILARVCLADDFLPGSSGSRCRQRLLTAVADQLVDSVPLGERPSPLVRKASSLAIWELFHHHVARASLQQRPQIAATLSYVALAPVIGPSAAVAAIRREQTA